MHTLLLDWSGTLVDDFTPTLYATNEVFKAYGLPVWSAEQFREKFYLPYPQFYEEMLPGVPLSELELIFRKSFNECPQKVAPLPKSLSFLRWAHQAGIQLIILSSMDTQNLERQAEEFQMRDLFTAVYAGVLNKCDQISEIMNKHALPPQKTAYVGDMEHDIEAAQSVGILSVAVLTGYDSLDTLASRDPSLILKHIGKLRPLIEASLP